MARWLVRLVLFVVLMTAVVVYTEIRREQDYQRLISVGDRALEAGDLSGAIEAFTGAVDLNDDSMLAHLKRGEAYRRNAQYSEALRDLRQAVALDPSATRPLEELGDVNAALGRFDAAAERYELYLARDERSPRLLYKAALARYRMGQVPAAIRALRQAVVLQPKFSEAEYLLGVCLAEQGRYEDAVTALRRAVDMDPSFVPPRQELTKIYRTLNRTSNELEQLAALATLEPERPERAVALGLGYARTGQTDTAIQTLDRAAQRFADSQPVRLALGRVWLGVAEARSDQMALNRAIDSLRLAANGPATSEALTLLGRALVFNGDIDRAIPVLERATAHFPVDPTAFKALAEAAQRRGRYQIERQALIQFDALSGDGPTARDSTMRLLRIADLTRRLGPADEVGLWVERAARLTPIGDVALVARVADTLLNVNEPASARALLDRALSRNPLDAELSALQRRAR